MTQPTSGREPASSDREEARILRRAMVEVSKIEMTRGYNDRNGKPKASTGVPRLKHLSVRVIPEDMETLDALALASARSQSFLARVALHMFIEAHRRNPYILRALE